MFGGHYFGEPYFAGAPEFQGGFCFYGGFGAFYFAQYPTCIGIVPVPPNPPIPPVPPTEQDAGGVDHREDREFQNRLRHDEEVETIQVLTLWLGRN